MDKYAQEREDARRLGIMLNAAAHGIRPDQPEFNKYAQLLDISSIGDNLTKILMTVSLLGGIPAGIAWHNLDQQSSATTSKEEQLKKKIEYYRDATSNIEGELARQGIHLDAE